MIGLYQGYQGTKQMKAIQSRKTFTDLSEARSYFDVMASKNRFIGGRVVKYYGIISVQVFFECDQAMESEKNCKGFAEPVSLIPTDKVSKDFALQMF